MEEHKKFPSKSNEKYFFQKETISSKQVVSKTSNPFVKSDQKHQKTISLHKFPNSFLNKESEISEESIMNKSANKSSFGLHLTSQQFNQIINEKKKAFNEKIPKTVRQEITAPSDNYHLLTDKNSVCKKCKENEENSKKMLSFLNNMTYEMAGLNEIESLWRNGNFSFENERIGGFFFYKNNKLINTNF